MTREEVKEKITQGIVIIPVGAIEQHGKHLSLNTDSVIIQEITQSVGEKFTEDLPILIAPVVSYGNSNHHFPYPTLSLTSETLIAVLKDLTTSLAKIGAEKILLLNSHGGNDEIIRIVARDISQAYNISVGAVSYWTIAWDRIIKEFSLSHLGRVPGHAGGFETSLMLALRSDEVKLEWRSPYRSDEIPTVENAKRIYVSHPNNSVGIDGISDDARHASKKDGEKLFSIIVEEVYKEVYKFATEKN